MTTLSPTVDGGGCSLTGCVEVVAACLGGGGALGVVESTTSGEVVGVEPVGSTILGTVVAVVGVTTTGSVVTVVAATTSEAAVVAVGLTVSGVDVVVVGVTNDGERCAITVAGNVPAPATAASMPKCSSRRILRR